MTDNPTFPAPLVPLTQLAGLQTAFADGCIASALGGKATTAGKNKCRHALVNSLRSQAGYVEHLCRGNLAGLLSSGFTNASTNRLPAPLVTPEIREVLNERSRELLVRLKPVANARNYQVQIRTGEDDWQELGFYSQARRIVVQGLTPGTVYQFRARALGGSNGCSDWCQPVGRMSL